MKEYSDEYSSLAIKQKEIDAKYAKILDEVEGRYDELAKKSYDYEKMQYKPESKKEMDKIQEEIEEVFKDWKTAQEDLPRRSREIINQYLKENNHDGMIIENDEGSLGRSTKTIIVLDPKQVRAADKEFSNERKGA